MSGENPRKQKEVRFFLPHTMVQSLLCSKKKTAKPRLRRHSLRRFFFWSVVVWLRRLIMVALMCVVLAGVFFFNYVFVMRL